MRQARRVPPKEWIPVLRAVYQFLEERQKNPIVFGSQAMSLYLQRPLESFDLDIAVLNFNLRKDSFGLIDTLKSDFQIDSYEVLEREGGDNVLHIFLRTKNNAPFTVEVFAKIVKRSPGAFLGDARVRRRWGGRYRTLSPDDIYLTKLATFKGLRVIDLQRLNNFASKVKIRTNKVYQKATALSLRNIIQSNVKDAKRRNKPVRFGDIFVAGAE